MKDFHEWSGLYTYTIITIGAGLLLFWLFVISFITGWF